MLRKNTLEYTLHKIDFQDTTPIIVNGMIPIHPQIKDAVYFYNLAIGSKSIENSLLLLWTSLECLNPFKHRSSDIENIQELLKYSLSIGCLGRELYSFVNRVVITNNVIENCFESLEPSCNFIRLRSEPLRYWLEWLCKEFPSSDDPYDIIKPISNLLTKKFVELNEVFTGNHHKYKTVKYWHHKIEKSMLSIEYQVDRIYLHRNQIVHAGKVMNEYTNLWNHLEWYVGKLLSYCFLVYSEEKNNGKSIEMIFHELRADHELLINILKNNEEKKIKDVNFVYNLVLKHFWQFI